jgi:hypothetical protein
MQRWCEVAMQGKPECSVRSPQADLDPAFARVTATMGLLATQDKAVRFRELIICTRFPHK